MIHSQTFRHLFYQPIVQKIGYTDPIWDLDYIKKRIEDRIQFKKNQLNQQVTYGVTSSFAMPPNFAGEDRSDPDGYQNNYTKITENTLDITEKLMTFYNMYVNKTQLSFQLSYEHGRRLGLTTSRYKFSIPNYLIQSHQIGYEFKVFERIFLTLNTSFSGKNIELRQVRIKVNNFESLVVVDFYQKDTTDYLTASTPKSNLQVDWEAGIVPLVHLKDDEVAEHFDKVFTDIGNHSSSGMIEENHSSSGRQI